MTGLRPRFIASMAVIILAIAGCGTAAFADDPPKSDDPQKSLEGMSLEKLLDVEVTSATKTKGFSVSEAPSVIRVFTRQDIERYGFRTLRDVLSNVPGVQVQEYRAGHQVAFFRGIKSRYNNKVLWLIDGVPVRDSYYGHTNIDEILPLDAVARIEIINGPGSVLYGANAFTGVVSITTRNAKNAGKEQREVRAAWSTYGTAQGGGEFSAGDFYGYGHYLGSSGFPPLLNNDGSAYRHDQEREGGYGLLKYDTERFQTIFSYTNYDYPDAYRKSGRDRMMTRSPIYGAMRYKQKISDRSSFNVIGYFETYALRKEETKYTSSRAVKSIEREVLDSQIYGVDFDFTHAAKKHTLVAGASFQGDRPSGTGFVGVYPTQYNDPALATPDTSRVDMGLFVQDIWALRSNIDLTTGLRYDYLSAFDSQVSFRTALTAQKGNTYTKFIVGTAFRVPSYREYVDVVAYNFGLQPEHLYTFEAQVGRKFRKGDLSVTLFHNSYSDLIKDLLVSEIVTPTETRIIDDDYSVNADSSRVTGLEFWGTYRPVAEFSLTAGASTLLSAKEKIGAIDPAIRTATPVDTNDIKSYFLSDFTFNLLADYRIPRTQHHFGVNLTYMSDRSVPASYQSAVPAAVRNPSNADGFAKLDLLASFRIMRSFDLQLHGWNMLNRKIFSPPYDDPTQYDMQWAGRTLMAELVFRY